MLDNIGSDYSLEVKDLFACLAEQIKMPLVQISAMADVMDPSDPEEVLGYSNNISEIGMTATQLIDGFLLGLRASNQAELRLEPIPIGSLLYDVANLVLKYARIVGCEVRLEVDRNCGLVMANPRLLKSAMINLAYSFINATQPGDGKPVRIVADYSNGSIMTGVFSNTSSLSKALFDNARRIKGVAHQPLHKFSSDNSAGVFVADNLLTCLGTNLDLIRYGGGVGLAGRLMPSSQLSLI